MYQFPRWEFKVLLLTETTLFIVAPMKTKKAFSSWEKRGAYPSRNVIQSKFVAFFKLNRVEFELVITKETKT